MEILDNQINCLYYLIYYARNLKPDASSLLLLFRFPTCISFKPKGVILKSKTTWKARKSPAQDQLPVGLQLSRNHDLPWQLNSTASMKLSAPGDQSCMQESDLAQRPGTAHRSRLCHTWLRPLISQHSKCVFHPFLISSISVVWTKALLISPHSNGKWAICTTLLQHLRFSSAFSAPVD